MALNLATLYGEMKEGVVQSITERCVHMMRQDAGAMDIEWLKLNNTAGTFILYLYH
jgi:hypothetical protein